MSAYKYIEAIEKNLGLFGVLLATAITIGGLAEIVPLFYQANTIEPSPGVEPYPPLELAGRDIYVSEGCYGCHSQQIRRLRAEVQRYGPFSRAGESVYDRPFQWGSKRTGPDLSRIGGKYSDEWHRQHLLDPRSMLPDSNMPAYKWLEDTPIDALDIRARMKVLRILGDPYTDAQIESTWSVLQDKTEMDALIAYLQSLGHAYPFNTTNSVGDDHE
ncbi:MAG: cytochrome-c oxidase, cbb3-type subunit II [Oceanococcus sp.]